MLIKDRIDPKEKQIRHRTSFVLAKEIDGVTKFLQKAEYSEAAVRICGGVGCYFIWVPFAWGHVPLDHSDRLMIRSLPTISVTYFKNGLPKPPKPPGRE